MLSHSAVLKTIGTWIDVAIIITCFGMVWPFWCWCAVKLWHNQSNQSSLINGFSVDPEWNTVFSTDMLWNVKCRPETKISICLFQSEMPKLPWTCWGWQQDAPRKKISVASFRPIVSLGMTFFYCKSTTLYKLYSRNQLIFFYEWNNCTVVPLFYNPLF